MELVKKETLEQEAQELIAKVLTEQDKAVKAKIIEALIEKGFCFIGEAPEEIDKLLFDRITIVTIEDQASLKLVYLDFVNSDNLGTFLFAYNTEVKQEVVEGVLKLSIG